MNRLHIAIAAATVSALAGAASAQFSISGSGNVERRYNFEDTTNPDLNVSEVNLDPFFGSAEDHARIFGAGDHPLLGDWETRHVAHGEQSNTRFALYENSAHTGELPAPLESISGIDFEGDIRVGVVSEITITESTMARISFDGFASALASDRSELSTSLSVSSAMGAFADFSAGFNTGAAVTMPFSFDVMLEAGDVIEIAYSSRNRSREVVGQASYFQEHLIDFSIEAIPAPGAAALFGLAGLTAARRRR